MKLLFSIFAAVVLLTIGFGQSRAEVENAVQNSLAEQLQELQFSLNRQLLESSEQVESLSTELNHLREAVDYLVWMVDRMGRSVQTIANDNGQLVRNVTTLTYQNEQIMLNQQYCANHEALKDIFFEMKPKCAPSDEELPHLPSHNNRVYRSCRDAPSRSGVYRIDLRSSTSEPTYSETTTTAWPTTTTSNWNDRPSTPFNAYCEQQKYGGGWMVIQKRKDGSVDFNRTWIEYREGFGNARGEYWLGLENLYQLTRTGTYELMIVMENFDDNSAYETYHGFHVSNEANGYRLTLTNGFSGTAGNALSVYSNEVFVTYDTSKSYSSCARQFGSGFWHYGCSSGDNRSNLNGIYGRNEGVPQGTWWGSFKNGSSVAMLKSVQMMIRAK